MGLLEGKRMIAFTIPLIFPQGKPTAPLVKDKFGSERRKAKTLNFSIAYGKTVHGLANDW
jgi:DNA polymerase-1